MRQVRQKEGFNLTPGFLQQRFDLRYSSHPRGDTHSRRFFAVRHHSHRRADTSSSAMCSRCWRVLCPLPATSEFVGCFRRGENLIVAFSQGDLNRSLASALQAMRVWCRASANLARLSAAEAKAAPPATEAATFTSDVTDPNAPLPEHPPTSTRKRSAVSTGPHASLSWQLAEVSYQSARRRTLANPLLCRLSVAPSFVSLRCTQLEGHRRLLSTMPMEPWTLPKTWVRRDLWRGRWLSERRLGCTLVTSRERRWIWS